MAFLKYNFSDFHVFTHQPWKMGDFIILMQKKNETKQSSPVTVSENKSLSVIVHPELHKTLALLYVKINYSIK